ncbi:MAG: NTP transferase domain-containing protein [Nitrospinota bacterium]
MSNIKIVLLAGYGKGARKIFKTNKVFLKIRGTPLFIYVLQTLLTLETSEKIVIVGPCDIVRYWVKKYFSLHPSFRQVVCVSQGNTLYENIEIGINEFFPFFKMAERQICLKNENEPILFLPGDIPLLTKAEVLEFWEKALQKTSDYCFGVVTQASIEQFREKHSLKKLDLFCFPFKEGFFRINNLHFLKPFKLCNGPIINKIYELRFLSRAAVKSPLTWELIRKGYWNAAFYFFLMLCTVALKKVGLANINRVFSVWLPVNKLERIVGGMFGVKISSVEVSDTSAAIDVDTAEDYKIMKTIFGETSCIGVSKNPLEVVRKGGLEPPRLPTGS